MPKSFNHSIEVYNDQSAEEIVPLLISMFHPNHVIDVGCGIGNFLKVFLKEGVQSVLGLDGKWVDRLLLSQNIPAKDFMNIDLDNEFAEFARKNTSRFDIALSLEVAEHLKKESAESFVSSLCLLSDTIIFSAAVPMQGGQDHINEQWPSYWIQLFEQNGFSCYDIIRPRIWSNEKIHWWYRQNIFCFTKSKNISVPPLLPAQPLYDIIHPRCYANRSKFLNDINEGRISFGYLFLLFRKIILQRFRK